MENSEFNFEPKLTELIAIGASIGGNCLPCLRFHIAEAIRLGVSIDEIQGAVKIGKTVKEKPINDIYKLAEDLISREKATIRPADGGKKIIKEDK